MQIQVDIGFEELVKAVEKLPEDQRLRLKEVLEENSAKSRKERLRGLLLNGPTLSEDQIQIMEENRKAIRRWRTK